MMDEITEMKRRILLKRQAIELMFHEIDEHWDRLQGFKFRLFLNLYKEHLGWQMDSVNGDEISSRLEHVHFLIDSERREFEDGSKLGSTVLTDGTGKV